MVPPNANDQLSGPQKAAIFIYCIGEEMASNIIKQLDEKEIKKLGTSMGKIKTISPKLVDTIFSEFKELATAPIPITIGEEIGSQFITKILTKAIDKDKARNLIEEIQEEEKLNFFNEIKRLDPKTVANFLRNEHPQTIALILIHLEPAQMSEIISEFPESLQADVIYRIAELEDIPPGIVEEIDQVLKAEVSTLKGYRGQRRGGVQIVAEILNQMDGTKENAILTEIESKRQGLADEIRKLMFVFEDLIQIDDRSLMTILKEINNETLMMALKTASEELKEKIFKNMSERASQMLKEDLEVMGPVRLKDVEAAQQSILQVAKKLESEGKIMLLARGKEEVFV